MRDYLDVDLEAITQQLKDQGAILAKTQAWMGEPVADERTLAQADHYHGDFKRSLEYGHAH